MEYKQNLGFPMSLNVNPSDITNVMENVVNYQKIGNLYISPYRIKT